MIVIVGLLCGGGGGGGGVWWRFFYIIIIQLHSLLGLGACSLQKILKKCVIWCVFVYIWIFSKVLLI